jgi:ferric-dicitrate binding protein FerR (iron transport regulator)
MIDPPCLKKNWFIYTNMAQGSLAYYLQRHLEGALSAEERRVLLAMLEDPAYQDELNNIADADLGFWERNPLPLHEGISRVKAALAAQIDSESAQPIDARPVHRVHFLRRGFVKYAAAILIILGVGIGAYWWNTQQETPALSKTTQPAPLKNDVAPGGNKALLTLADGQTIVLDSAANGALADQGAARITKTDDGKIIYRHLEQKLNAPVVYNTMTTPRGGQYQVTLPDGTQVWLNAASSLTYPTVFNGSARQVSITGEAYFEVTHNQSKPFLVDVAGKSTVRVLGTHFNINAYADDGTIRTTLLEGSVQTGANAGSSVTLQPGQQAVQEMIASTAVTKPKVVAANTAQVLAWRNGIFNFQHADLKSVLKQVERWYNVDIQYQGTVPDIEFRGEMDRGVMLSGVMRFLSDYGLQVQLQGRTLTISK